MPPHWPYTITVKITYALRYLQYLNKTLLLCIIIGLGKGTHG